MAGSNIDGNQKLPFCIAGGAAVADFDGQRWTSDGDYDLIDAACTTETVGAAGASIFVRKCTSGQAKTAGVTMLSSAGFASDQAVNVPVVLGPSLTAANARLKRGDAIAVGATAAALGLDGVSVTVRLRAIPEP